ncbi:hypothetical protein RQV66_000513 [Vibrio alginolyticus]|uniref:hypothetical protein n=1 Tax=Vibrio harveyi group TaxID=717610 RepID=UPI00215C93D6|nr:MULTISPECIES: hypothetical protein [Vibrio harveyi group]ELI1832719.1 hypothetical protein [Vibrio alginolyticus]MCR9441354.1 hypothetical protein [Vibrio alginolyticus]MCS0133638.1 hypothetical protein [Vibrio alginolyticus]
MKITELIELYPQFTKQQLIRLRTTFNNIKSRCNSKCNHHKHYHDVDFNFTDLIKFIDFILSEKSKGRDYFTIKNPHICRLFDKGEYSPTNCIIRSRKQNIRESSGYEFKIYDSLTGKVEYFNSVNLFYEINKHVLNISLATLYRRIKDNKIITVTDGVTSGYIKISYIK